MSQNGKGDRNRVTDHAAYRRNMERIRRNEKRRKKLKEKRDEN
jgi:hypothetical protein